MNLSNGKDRIIAAVIAAFSACALFIVFAQPLLSKKPLSAPDAAPAAFAFGHQELPALMAGGWYPADLGALSPPDNLSPTFFLMFLLQPQQAVLWGYIVNALLLYCAAFALLRALGVSTIASLIGAIAMAFSTHTLTLVSAGHLTKNGMVPFAVLTFACLQLAVSRRSFFWFAALGVVAGTGLAEHYDVMLMFCLLAAAYGVFKLANEYLQSRDRAAIVRLSLGGVLAVIVTVATFLPAIGFIVDQVVPGREAAATTSGGNNEEEKWEFATNWSLPPEELVEFIAPAIFGRETGSPDAPYWGRTGQTKGWEKTHQGLRNLRQHGLYLGVIQLVFALLAVVCAFRGIVANARRREILFWAAAWIVIVLIALGRYGPLYWLFYKLPYASNIRCPIKFMHLIELATVALFAFGLDEFLSQAARRSEDGGKKTLRDKPCWSGFVTFSFVASAVAMLAAIMVSIQKQELFDRLAATGFADSSMKLLLVMIGALLRAAFCLAVVGGLFLAARRWQGHARMVWLMPLLVAFLVAMDMVSVAFPYVKVEDNTFMYTENVLVDRLKQGPELYRVTCPVNDPLSQQLETSMFPYFDIQALRPCQGSSVLPRDKELGLSLAGDIMRFWQVGNGGFVFGPREALAQLLKHKAFEPVMGVDLIMGADRQPQFLNAPAAQAAYLLLRNNSALPRALLFHDWEAVDEKTVFKRLSEPAWDPHRSVLVEGLKSSRTGNGETSPVRITKYEPSRIEIDADAKAEGVLLLNDHYDPNWRVEVNGKPAELLYCNGIMRGVHVPEGKNHVVFIFDRPYIKHVVIKLTAIGGVLLWGLARLLGYFLKKNEKKN